MNRRPLASFVPAFDDAIPESAREEPTSGVRTVARPSEPATTQKLPAQRPRPTVAARAPGVDARVLCAARLVTPEEREVLDALDHVHEPMLIAARLGTSVPRATAVLASLTRRGLVVRRPVG